MSGRNPEMKSEAARAWNQPVADPPSIIEMEVAGAADSRPLPPAIPPPGPPPPAEEKTISAFERAGTSPSAPERVAVIGASAGGVTALEAFFTALPVNTGVAFIVLELAPEATARLISDRLERRTTMPIRSASTGDPVVVNEVLVVPPGHRVAFEDGGLRLEAIDEAAVSGDGPSVVDSCLRSLAKSFGPQSIAIVISGADARGGTGVEHVADVGGTVIVQTPDSAEFPEVPRHAIATGRVDHVLGLAEAARLLAWIGGRELVAERLFRAAGEGASDSVLAVIRELVEAGEDYGLDRFNPRMLARKMIQRMLAVNTTTPEEYAERLRWDAEERLRLRDAMIDGTGAFFRDPDAWRTLQELVIRRLVQGDSGEPIRIWVVGCSTGADAYAVALQFEEELRRADRRMPYKIFATDLISGRVELASSGRFDPGSTAAIPRPMLTRGFTMDGQTAVVMPSLRQRLVFARHDVRTDPAFTKLDLIVCRGVLSAFDDVGRSQAVARIIQGLRPRGTLFVDAHDAIDDMKGQLRPLDRSSGMYSRGASATGAAADGASRVARAVGAERTLIRRQREVSLATALEAVLGSCPGRMCLLLGTDGQLLHAYGDTERFLTLQPGTPVNQVPELFVEPLRASVEAAIERTLRTGQTVSIPGPGPGTGATTTTTTTTTATTTITVAPVAGDRFRDQQLSLVVETVPMFTSSDGSANADGQVSRLAADLDRTQAGLRDVGDELAIALRQRRALVEELRETARRAHENHAELMSVNEELYTVNREHEAKIRELLQLNSDMENLLRTAHVGTIFFDRDLQIRRRTPASDILFRRDASSELSAGDIALPTGVDPLAPDLRSVIQGGTTIERQLRLDDGHDYLLHMHPYRRTDDGRLDGAVVTIVDVSDLKRAERQLRRLNTELQNRNQEAESFAHTVSHDLKSPLVTIGCMMGLLRESLGDSAGGESIQYVEQTETTVRSMRQTIDDLLELSRVGRTRNRITSVDLSDLVGEVLQAHAVEFARDHVSVQVSDRLPVIEADRRRLSQVVDNLVDNAFKYGRGTRESNHAVIEIDVEEAGDRIILSVSDRGPGVPEGFREQVFGLFQRLRRDQPGTGVGLALVRRIIDAHGGRVWVEGREGGGARFRVMLPKVAPLDEVDLADLGFTVDAASDSVGAGGRASSGNVPTDGATA